MKYILEFIKTDWCNKINKTNCVWFKPASFYSLGFPIHVDHLIVNYYLPNTQMGPYSY